MAARSFDKVPFSAPNVVSADVASLFVCVFTTLTLLLCMICKRTFEIEIIKKELF
jgi:hypothetical protein